jgi:hypothetical protein
LSREARGPQRRLLDAAEVVVERVPVGQAGPAELGEAENRREQVVEVVRDPARQPPDRFDALRVLELRPQVPCLRGRAGATVASIWLPLLQAAL